MAEREGKPATEPFDAGTRPAAAGAALMLLFVLGALGIAALFTAGGRPAPAPREFPAPRLQPDPAAELRGLRERQNRLLSEYSWVDPSRDVIRVPIERAMELVAERGLPHRKEKTP